MGYCYTNAGALCCDACGHSGGVRKRTCPYKVGGLPYCYPPALCAECYAKHKATLHARCKEPAAARQREEDARMETLKTGALERGAAWGDWQDGVPKGMVGIVFRALDGREEWVLVPKDGYNRATWLHDYPEAQPWPNHPGASTKEVA